MTSRQGYNEVNMTDFTQGEQIRTKSKLRRALACTVCILLTVPLRSLVSSSSLDAMIANSNLMLTPDDVICFFFPFITPSNPKAHLILLLWNFPSTTWAPAQTMFVKPTATKWSLASIQSSPFQQSFNSFDPLAIDDGRMILLFVNKRFLLVFGFYLNDLFD